MPKRRIFLYIFLIITLLFGAGPSYALKSYNDVLVLTLDDCIKLALENNEKLKGAGYAIKAAESRLKEAKAAFWPVIEYEYWLAPVPTDATRAFNAFFEGELALFNRIKVGVGIPIFASGQLMTAKKLAKVGIEATKQLSRKEQADVVLKIKQLYYGVLLANEIDKLLADAINKINKELKEQHEKEIPTYAPYDLLKLRVFRIDLERRLAETRNNRDLAMDGLRIQMGLAPRVEFRLAVSLLKPQVVRLGEMEKYIKASMEHHPDAQLVDVNVRAKRLEYKLEKQKMGPKAGFGFFVDIGRVTEQVRGLAFTDDFNDPFDFSRAGLGMRLEGKFDFHGAYARIKRAKAEYLKSVYERMIAHKGLSLDAQKSYMEAKRRQDDVKRARKAESMARQMMFLSKTNYEIGIGDEKDYTDALQLVLLTRGKYFEAVFHYNVALAELEQKVGEMNYEKLTERPAIPEYEMFGINGEEEFMEMEMQEEEETFGEEEYSEDQIEPEPEL